MRGYPGIAVASRAAQDAELARRLWDFSARLTGIDSRVRVAKAV